MSKEIEVGKPSFVLDALLWVLVVVFCFSLFKNISYPLIWNDESESVMVGSRVLEYGYPKVHDGKNVVFMSLAANIKDKEGNLVGYKPEIDAYIYMTWGNYYWAAMGVYLSQFKDDIYSKTAMLRLPFAIMGFLGLIVFVLPVRKLFAKRDHYLIFLILFVFVELFSISLVLHIREARYFSLVIFLSACFFYVYSKYFIFKTTSTLRYYILMTLLLFFTYQINFIAFAIFCAVLGINIAAVFVMNVFKAGMPYKSELISAFKSSIPVFISIVLIFPFLIFYETFKISAAISEHNNFTFETYKTNIIVLVRTLTELEFVYLFAIVKIVWFIFWKYLSPTYNKANSKRLEPINLLNKFSFFATSFLIIYSLMIARTPYLFVRHYIVLQPVIMMVMLVDIFCIYQYISLLEKKRIASARFACTLLFLISFSVNAKNKMPYVKDHIYEITHQYKGTLDYVIPYIKDNFKNTDSLIIATNYEEFSYMYYLGSKVIVGYIYNNIEEDVKYTPDIIMYRKSWGTDPKVFNDFIQKAKYQRVSFPVADYPVNNIPELNFMIKHLFKTKLASTEQEQAEIFVRVKE